jgi:hypothetical protein
MLDIKNFKMERSTKSGVCGRHLHLVGGTNPTRRTILFEKEVGEFEA